MKRRELLKLAPAVAVAAALPAAVKAESELSPAFVKDFTKTHRNGFPFHKNGIKFDMTTDFDYGRDLHITGTKGTERFSLAIDRQTELTDEVLKKAVGIISLHFS